MVREEEVIHTENGGQWYMCKQAGRQAGRQADRQTDRQAGRQAGKKQSER